MPSIVTDRFRIKNAMDFIESVGEDNHYLTIGRVSPWGNPALVPSRTGTDAVPPIPFDTRNESDKSHWADTLAAKKITAGDVRHMIRRYDWTSGTRYDVYSADDNDLYRKAFYVLTDQVIGSQTVYRVYKCMARPASGNSTVKPVHNTAAVVTLADNFAWKFMYELSDADVVKFLTPQHIPVNNVKSSGNITQADANSPVSDDSTLGHGYDPVRELGAYFIGVNVRLEFDEQGTFTTENDYRKIGIVYNPRLWNSSTLATAARYRQTYRLSLTAAPASAFIVDETITFSSGSARVVGHFVNPDTGEISTDVFVQLLSGSFPGTNFTITNGTTTATVNASLTATPQLRPQSGDWLFMEYRKPIPRSPDQIESLTVVLEF